MSVMVSDLWRRWRIWLLLPGLVSFGITAFAPDLAGAGFLFPLLGSLFLSFEFVRGVARPTLLQPVTQREIAQAWWVFAVVIPWAICVTGAALGWGVRLFHDPAVAMPTAHPSAFPLPELPPHAGWLVPHPPTLTWEIALKGWLLQAAFAALWDAFFFFALTMLPVARTADTVAQIGQGFGGALWGLNVGAGIFIMQGLGRMLAALPAIHPAAWTVVAASLPMALVSRLLSENLVAKRTSMVGQLVPPPQAAARGVRLSLGESMGGLRQFILRETFIQSVMLWGFAVFGWVGFTAVLRYQGARDAQPPAAVLGGFFALIPAVRSLIPSMRHLRSLPISIGKLAFILVVFPATIVLVNTVLVNVVFSGFAAGSWAVGLVQGMALSSIAALGVAGTMKFKPPLLIMALGCASGPLVGAGHFFHRAGALDPSMLAGITAVGILLQGVAYGLARHWLRTSTVLYRPQRMMMFGFGAAPSR